MIDNGYVKLMARYNRWQNESLYREAGALGDDARRAGRGAFFGSIQGTLSHLWWADAMWMHRFSGSPKPDGDIAGSPALFGDWADLAGRRNELDAAILSWADLVEDEWLAGELTWMSRAERRVVSKPRWVLVTHFFNHQTHHRGQTHALLTAAGARPDPTDIPFMPDA